LYCTLAERKGNRSWPIAYYSVQIKSTPDPWEFRGRESVDWLLNYPAPLLLSVVDKRNAVVSIYQATTRFQAGVVLELPERMSLVPGEVGDGSFVEWPDTETFELNAPILHFSVGDLSVPAQFANIRRILLYWVENDAANIRRLQIGLRKLAMPYQYRTNELPGPATGSTFLAYTPTDERHDAEETLRELLEWVGPLELNDGLDVEALLTALLLRARDPEGEKLRADLFFRVRSAHQSLPPKPVAGDYLFRPFDSLLKKLEALFAAEARS
jgi:hypothetical protein